MSLTPEEEKEHANDYLECHGKGVLPLQDTTVVVAGGALSPMLHGLHRHLAASGATVISGISDEDLVAKRLALPEVQDLLISLVKAWVRRPKPSKDHFRYSPFFVARKAKNEAKRERRKRRGK